LADEVSRERDRLRVEVDSVRREREGEREKISQLRERVSALETSCAFPSSVSYTLPFSSLPPFIRIAPSSSLPHPPPFSPPSLIFPSLSQPQTVAPTRELLPLPSERHPSPALRVKPSSTVSGRRSTS
jgi:hypothetical protein